ncbi:aldolase/citrate lyase family protein [Microbacterium sp. NPDC076895]|uniref:HpcH/HpaI aldolase family protein n=1 Tax=Microbacterium sp. NPDC076895 TaxID=3154957 RepID=UPI003441D693
MIARIGAWALLGSPAAAAVLAATGPDWLVVDAQHGRFDDRAVCDTLAVVADLPSRPQTFVRVADGAAWLIGRALDAGADGVIVPMVQDADAAAAAARACRYPPLGARSWGQLAGTTGRVAVPAAQVNDTVQCAVMVETATAIGHVEEIAATPGIDMVFVGPFDLALSLGVDVNDLLFDERDGNPLDRIVAACRRHGISAGAFAGSPERARLLIARGFDTVSVAVDSAVLSEAATASLTAARAGS